MGEISLGCPGGFSFLFLKVYFDIGKIDARGKFRYWRHSVLMEDFLGPLISSHVRELRELGGKSRRQWSMHSQWLMY